MITTTGNAGIAFAGSTFNINNNINALNLGPLTITNSGVLTLASGITLSSGGAFNQNGSGSVSLGSTINSGGTINFNSPINLIGNSTLNSSSNGNNITLEGIINGAFSLTLTAGTGNIHAFGAIDHTIPLAAFTVSGGNAQFDSSINVAGPITVNLTGSAIFNGPITTTTLSGITVSGTVITFNGSVGTSNGGPIVMTNSGLLTIPAGITFTSSGSITQSGSGTISLGSNIISNGNMQFAAPISLTQPITLNTNGGDLILSGTVDGNFNLSLTSGTGNITLGGAIGGITPLAAVTIQSGNNVTTQAISSSSITQVAGTGLTHFSRAPFDIGNQWDHVDR